MSQPRHDFRPSPTPDKYGLPGITYPTGNKSQFVVVVEDVEIRAGDGPLAPYTQHPATGIGGVAAAVLTSESPARGDGTRKHLRRVFETLPGPWIYDTRYDNDLGPIQIRRRAVRFNTANIGVQSVTGKTTFTAREGSALVSLETQEAWSDGTGSAGNPVYPINTAPIYYDPEKGSVKETTQVVNPSGSEAASVTINDGTGVVTEIDYLPRNDDLLTKKTKTFTLAGPVLTKIVYDSESNVNVTLTTQLVKASTAEPTVTDDETDFRSEEIVSGVYKRFTHRKYPSDLLTTTFKTVKEDRFVYPAILTGVTFGYLEKYREDLPDNPGTYILSKILRTTTPVIQAERPRVVPHLIATTFTSTAPTTAAANGAIYKIEPQRNEYRGFLWSLVTGAVLQDAASYSLNTGSGDPDWPNGGVIETYTTAASNPTATAYLALRSTNAWIALTVVYTKIAKARWRVDTITIPAL